MGMSYEQFWYGDPCMAKAYRDADKLRRKRKNEELWLSGVYMAEAISATVGNMFSKSKYEYPSEPKPITMDEIEEIRKAVVGDNDKDIRKWAGLVQKAGDA